MKTRRSSAKNETSNDFVKFKSPYNILNDATCESLKFDCNLACTHCIGNIEIFRKATSSLRRAKWKLGMNSFK